MVLSKLVMRNFQGVKSFDLSFPGGCSASIYGDNGTGKTTVFNALTWLLFDRASTGAKGFTPKPRGKDGEIHNLDSSVTGEFLMEDGKIVSFTKTYHEVWKKKRGTAQETLDGHSIDYEINGVPSTQKDFNAAILNFCGSNPEKPKILTMPDYFPEQLDWQSRRKILLEVCGNVSDEEVIASNEELRELPAFLRIPGAEDQSYSIDEYRKIVAAQRKKINTELDAIPARIDEAQKAIPVVNGMSEKDAQAAVDKAQKEVSELMAKRAGALADDSQIAEIRQQIAEKRAELAEARGKYQDAVSARKSAINGQLWGEEDAINVQKSGIKSAENSLRELRDKLASMESTRQAILAQYQETASRRWDSANENCPTCGQKLPANQVAQMRARFNESRSKTLEALNRQGKESCSKEMIASTKEAIASQANKLEEMKAALADKQAELESMQASRVDIPEFEKTPQYAAFMSDIQTLMQKQTSAMSGAQAATAGIDEAIRQKQEELAAAQEQVAGIRAAYTQAKRIAELETEEKKLTAEFDRTEKALYLCDLFVKTKVRRLTAQINERFHTVSFQLFVDQINGGIKECCEVLVPGEGGRMVPYAYANNAARINAGLEIIGTLSKYWNLRMPVVIDNCEAVTHPLKIDTQEIRLYVSEPDKALRLELDQ